MATTYKTFSNNDVASTRTLLHEAIPVTGTIVSGTYGDNNIKNYSHGMFQSVYDYPYQSSSANHIFDITMGYSSNVANIAYVQNTKKNNIYNMMAQVLVGHDHLGNIKLFDRDGDESTASDKMESCIFINMARLLAKDEIKKGSFQMILGVSTSSANLAGTTSPFRRTIKVYDYNAATNFKTNSPVGEYGLLYVTNVVSSAIGTSSFANPTTRADGTPDGTPGTTGEHPLPVGHIYYQAGIVVLSGSVFMASQSLPNVGGLLSQSVHTGPWGAGGAHTNVAFLDNDGSASYMQTMTGTAITGAADMFRRRIQSVQFNNTTELNSTIYYCRANHNDFNYSSNPTYISNSKIRIKNVATDNPISYMTTIGLYSADNELLAVAKLSEPLRKDPTNELTLRVRLDY